MKILKFGGTSVGSVDSIRKLLDIIEREAQNPCKPVIVLSAMSGVTNLLSAMADKASQGGEFGDELRE
ncbi:MAG: hypothetical protein H7069_05550, partial [Phormidesmis sp. FL-bin-119]|nr:hypothetical protein [Pedobacter sp.]